MFCVGFWDLLYNSWFKRNFKGNLGTRLLGPYRIDQVFDNEIVRLTTNDENQTPLFSNVHQLRLYHKPISRDAFVSHVATDLDCQLVQEQGSSPVSKMF